MGQVRVFFMCSNIIFEIFLMKKLYAFSVATLAMGLRPKQRGLEGCGQRGSARVTLHALKSVGKCEGMNLHTPKATRILGNGVSVDS
jgi:hypothetical protein